MSWPIVDLTFWNPGDGRSDAIDQLLADPSTPLAKHGLTGIAAAYSRETQVPLHPTHARWAHELTTRSLGIDGALGDVVALFDEAQLPYFVAKGPAIAYESYADPGLRPYCDLDVYVPSVHETRARAILRGAGYEPVDHALGALGGLAQEEHGGRFGATVELHCHVVDNLHRRHLPPVEAFLPYVERRRIAGLLVPVPGPGAHLALQAIHAGAGHRYAKLILLRDFLASCGEAPLPSELGAEAYASTLRSLLAGLGRASANGHTAGTLQRPLSQALLRTNPASWDEYALTPANLLALLHQRDWGTTGRTAFTTAWSARPRRNRRVGLRGSGQRMFSTTPGSST